MDRLNTVGSLIRYIEDTYTEEIENFCKLGTPENLNHFLPKDALNIIYTHINLYRVSKKDIECIEDSVPTVNKDKDSIKYWILLKYIGYKILSNTRYKNINMFKKHLVNKAQYSNKYGI